MATVPRAVLDYTTRQVNALSSDAQKKVLNVLESVDWDTVGVSAGRELVVQALQAVLPTYTAAAAQAGADLYDAVRLLQVGEALGATAISGYNPDATDGAVRAFAQDIVDGKDTAVFNRSVLDRVDYEVRRAANMSVVENAVLDPLKTYYARVPTGFETCEFCLMLASFGYLPISRKPALHVHSNCDCRLVPAYDGMEIEGYDPDALYEQWKAMREGIARNVTFDSRQVGQKIGKHAEEWGLDPSSSLDRQKFLDITNDIIENADQVTRGEWRSQSNPCTFYRKGDDIVIVNALGEYVTTMKGGASNARYKRTLDGSGD